ncbi:MAG: hypothetical protein VYE15_06200 [Myxococcota bacterium]|nr:hypothetical protein [Myxococcota bacterium]
MSESSATHASNRSLGSWVFTHLPALLYGWFWVGMFLCGLLAPADRVLALDSALIQEGWHLSLMACVLGIPPLTAYWLRMSGRWESPGD